MRDVEDRTRADIHSYLRPRQTCAYAPRRQALHFLLAAVMQPHARKVRLIACLGMQGGEAMGQGHIPTSSTRVGIKISEQKAIVIGFSPSHLMEKSQGLH